MQLIIISNFLLQRYGIVHVIVISKLFYKQVKIPLRFVFLIDIILLLFWDSPKYSEAKTIGQIASLGGAVQNIGQ